MLNESPEHGYVRVRSESEVKPVWVPTSRNISSCCCCCYYYVSVTSTERNKKGRDSFGNFSEPSLGNSDAL
jgi:hypothetical protein